MESDPRRSFRDVSGFIAPLVALIVYANSLFNGFALDDHDVILNNPLFREGDLWRIISSIDTLSDGQLLPLYRPFTYLTFLLESKLHQFDPVLVRALNVTLHAVNTLLVHRIVRALTGNDSYAPTVAALLFALHPINTEGVDFNAGGRNTMLACLFPLASLLLHDSGIRRRSPLRCIAAGFLYLCGLLSKESAIMIAPFILWLELRARRERRDGMSAVLIRSTPYIVATGAYLCLRWWVLSRHGIQTSIIPGTGTDLLETLYVIDPLGTRLFNNLYIIPRYLWSILFPVALAPRHVIPDDLNLYALPLFLTWSGILVGIGLLLTRWRNRVTLFGLAWSVAFWLPTSGLFVIPIPLAERYLYAPAIGLWIIAGWAFDTFHARFPAKRGLAFVTLGVLSILLAGVTVVRNRDWRSNLTLYTRFVRQFPENIHARTGLGIAYYDENKPGYRQIAADIFEQALRIDPYHPKINTLLGNIRLDQGDLQSALGLYTRALEAMPNDKEALINRGITFEKLGRKSEALEDYRRFLSLPGKTDHLPGGREHAENRIRALSE